MTRAQRETPAPRRPDALLAFMDGLADPTRLRILRALERGELSVEELRQVLALPQSTVSRHLKVLSDGGWLTSRREGTQSRWGFAPELDPGARRLWLVARSETDGWPALREDAARLEAVRARRDGAQRFFAGAAGAWDKLRAEVYGAAPLREALLALVPSEWTVADLGCGTGAIAAELAPHVCKVVGVDASAAMLRAARRRTSVHGNVELHEGRLEALPLPDASCDAAVLALVLSYVEDPAAALREALRILRPGGRLAIVEAARHEDEVLRRRMGQARPGFAEDELRAALREAGAAPRPVLRAISPEPGAKGPGLVVAVARAAHIS